MSPGYVLALDEGSSSARAILVGRDGEIVSEASAAIAALFPHPGWVELDPETLWQAAKDSMRRAMAKVGATALDILAVGVTTHRESCLIWDRATGVPVYNAIMWMSKQTDDIVNQWAHAGMNDEIRSLTGVRNDSYFSAGKLAWILENVPGVRADAEAGKLAAGTVDTWLLWKLTAGRSHLTDPSSASRTAMFDIRTGTWHQGLCESYGIPLALLPEVRPSNSHFGFVDASVFERGSEASVPIMAILADQQAGLYGQACLSPGMAKNTYGTAGVLVANVGTQPLILPGMSSSVAWQIDNETTYEVEGVVFHSGQTLQWLRDKLRVIGSVADTEAMAQSVANTGGVYFVPAFAGLCDPYWDRDVRASIMGLTLETDLEHLVRASLEAMAYQTRDNVDALALGGITIPALRVDGGAISNNFLCQFQADILGVPVHRPHGLERTALGVARLAGLGVGLWNGTSDLTASWQIERVFEPQMSTTEREDLYGGWQEAVAAARSLPPRRVSRSTSNTSSTPTTPSTPILAAQR